MHEGLGVQGSGGPQNVGWGVRASEFKVKVLRRVASGLGFKACVPPGQRWRDFDGSVIFCG